MRGTFVYELNGKEYILTKKESDEVEAFSSSEPDDNKYNKWFLDYVRQNNIPPKEDKSRSQYWSRIHSSGDDIAKMATIQRAVTTLVRVVSPEIKAGEVSFNETPTSTVNLAEGSNREITLPVGPTKDKSLHEAIDAVAGYGIHEAYHLKDTTKVLTTSIRKAIQEQSYSGLLYNFVEDLRVNKLGNDDNPGFAHYLEEAFDEIYKNQSDAYQLPDEWPTPDPTATNDRLLAAERMAALLGPIQYEKHIGNGSDKPYYDKIKAARSIVDNYANKGRDATSSNLQETVNRLMSLLDVSIPPQQQIPQPKLPMTMDGVNSKDEGTDEADNISAAAAAGLEGHDLNENDFATGAGFGDSTVTILRPDTPSSPWNKIGKLPNEVLKADAALRLTKTRSRNEDRYMRSGDLDEDELYRLYAGDDRVFIDVTEEVEEEAVVYMIVDSSSSMRASASKGADPWNPNPANSRTLVASQMAWLLAHSMSKKKHVSTKVFAHTSGTAVCGLRSRIGGNGTIIYRIFEKGESFDRIDWLLNVEQGGTPDQVALAVVGNEIVQEEAPSKYIIMINDGTPGGEFKSGKEEVRDVVDKLTRKGVNVVQIGISPTLTPAEQAEMYNHYVYFKNINQTIRDLAKILDKVR